MHRCTLQPPSQGTPAYAAQPGSACIHMGGVHRPALHLQRHPHQAIGCRQQQHRPLGAGPLLRKACAVQRQHATQHGQEAEQRVLLLGCTEQGGKGQGGQRWR